MKKIINGRKYDTATARLMASDFYSHPGDFSHWREELYRKKTGEYFLYGEGGPMTPYAERVGMNGFRGGERIFPMTEAEAREWAEAHVDADEYETIFGEADE